MNLLNRQFQNNVGSNFNWIIIEVACAQRLPIEAIYVDEGMRAGEWVGVCAVVAWKGVGVWWEGVWT